MRYRTRPALPARRDVPLPEVSALTMTRRGARLGFRLVRRGKTYRWVRAFDGAEEATRIRACVERAIAGAGYDDRDGEELKLPPPDPLQTWKDACIGDDDARLVYGDMLAERGDPRAELIAAQARAETDPAAAPEAARLVTRYRAEILGGLAPALGFADVAWRRGFIDSVVLARGPDEPPTGVFGWDYWAYQGARTPFDFATPLVRLLTEPSAELLRSLTLHWEGDPSGDALRTAEVVALLVALLPRGLERLVLDRSEHPDVVAGQGAWGDVTELFAVLPRLADVSISDDAPIVVRPFHAPSLRTLTLLAGIGVETARALAASTCPQLEELHVARALVAAEGLDVLQSAFGDRVR